MHELVVHVQRVKLNDRKRLGKKTLLLVKNFAIYVLGGHLGHVTWTIVPLYKQAQHGILL